MKRTDEVLDADERLVACARGELGYPLQAEADRDAELGVGVSDRVVARASVQGVIGV